MALLRALLAILAAALSLAGPAALAQVTSPQPDSVGITIYRAPDRGGGDAMNLAWLQGYALVTERRTITIPRGRATIRFEGVAGGILPESAIVTGLPDGVREKNLDADLLSPGSLYARSLGRPVILRRTRNGKVTEERAIVRSGLAGAAILETSEGFIAANCGPQREQLVFESLPAGLSARPTLSVETESAEERQVTVTLSYLAWGFDWQANYIATMRPDGRSADLFAWVTLANGDVTSFADAETAVVAGRINFDGNRNASRPRSSAQQLTFQCFFQYVQDKIEYAPAMAMAEDGEIVVTAQRRTSSVMGVPTAVTVISEELGDLKLYRVPHRTTVAANSQKQVGLLSRQKVPVQAIYRTDVEGSEASGVAMILRANNRERDGLGLPMPAGPIAVFEPSRGEQLLIGQGWVPDKAVGELVDIVFGDATQVTATVTGIREEPGGAWKEWELKLTNANPWPVRFEALFDSDDGFTRTRTSARLGRKDGRDLWAVTIPANGTASLRYRLTPAKGED